MQTLRKVVCTRFCPETTFPVSESAEYAQMCERFMKPNELTEVLLYSGFFLQMKVATKQHNTRKTGAIFLMTWFVCGFLSVCDCTDLKVFFFLWSLKCFSLSHSEAQLASRYRG